MKIIKKLVNVIVYYTTTKPQCYVHIDSPINNQERRQIQYNNRCKRIGVYSGSYLPSNPNLLTKKKWKFIKFSNKKQGMFFIRKSNSQLVRYDFENNRQYAHYHWHGSSGDQSFLQKATPSQYYDRYGKVCSVKNPRHHLTPLDKIYIRKNLKNGKTDFKNK